MQPLGETSVVAPVCPSCGATLKKKPERKILCPRCKKPIFVRYGPSDRKKKLVTQSQADDIEREWAQNSAERSLQSGKAGRFAGRSRDGGSKVPEWNVYRPSLTPTFFSPGATEEQKAFYTFFENNLERGTPVDVDGDLSYLFVYIYQAIFRFVEDKDLDALVACFERLRKGYSNYERRWLEVQRYLDWWLTDAYLYLNNYDSAWQLMRKKSSLCVDDVLNVRAKCSETTIDGNDLLGIWGYSTGFGRAHHEEIVNLATAMLADFHREHGMNFIEHFSKQFALERTQDDIDRLEAYFPNENEWARKEFARLKWEWGSRPKSTERTLFGGVPFPFVPPTFAVKVKKNKLRVTVSKNKSVKPPRIASVELPKIVERALRYEIKKILRECENTVKEASRKADWGGTLNELPCPSCGSSMSPDARFCRQCGKPLVEALKAAEAHDTNAVCPYCGAILEGFPKSKKICPACKKPILIRSRRKTNKLVTEAQAKEIDCKREIARELQELDGPARTQFESAKMISTQKNGVISQKDLLKTLRDVKWQMYNRELVECAKGGYWGAYRNVRFNMGEQLRKEAKFAEALAIYLEVLYLDTNGEPADKGVWNTELGFIAPAVVKRIQRIIKKLALTREQTKEIFLNNDRIDDRLELPISVSQAWSKLENELVFK
jgi:predicted amidophosphoribosyltransferase